MKKTTLGSIAALAIVTVAALPRPAGAQLRPADGKVQPAPVLKLLPSFDCAATVNATTGLVTITKSNAATVDKTTDVVAVVNTPSGKVSTAVCGSGFADGAPGTKQSVSFVVPKTSDKSWIYTCTASQAQTTSACKPPK